MLFDATCEVVGLSNIFEVILFCADNKINTRVRGQLAIYRPELSWLRQDFDVTYVFAAEFVEKG